MAGYSGKSLVDKLGIAPGDTVALLHAPADFTDRLGALPPRVVVRQRASTSAQVTLLFATKATALARDFERVAREMTIGGMIWVAWPKKSSGRETDVDENVVRQTGLAAGLVDVKVCAIDDVWSGLKFLRRRTAK